MRGLDRRRFVPLPLRGILTSNFQSLELQVGFRVKPNFDEVAAGGNEMEIDGSG